MPGAINKEDGTKLSNVWLPVYGLKSKKCSDSGKVMAPHCTDEGENVKIHRCKLDI